MRSSVWRERWLFRCRSTWPRQDTASPSMRLGSVSLLLAVLLRSAFVPAMAIAFLESP